MSHCSADIRMLGGFELRNQHGEVVSLTVRKAEAVLALLALAPGRALTRSKLCGMLWPNVPETQARHSLRQALVAIRKAVPHALTATTRTLALDATRARVDTEELARGLGAGTREALERVAQVYRGDLLDGIDIGEEPFEQWLTLERERLRADVMRGLCKLIELHTSAHDALQVSQQILQLDPLHEHALRACMRLLAQLGRRAEALQRYQSYASALRRALGAEPESETKQLFVTLGAATPQLASQGAPKEPAAALTRVREQVVQGELVTLESCALRSAELSQLMAAYSHAHAVGAEVGLVAGEAGVGKSHLCAQLARRLAADDCRVLRGRCFESEQVLPFACWADLLLQAQLAEDTATLEALPLPAQRELARLLPQLTASAPLRAAEDPSAMFHALANVLAIWTQAGPLCLMLEDLHWADEMSLRFLCFAARRLSSVQGCFILATVRSEECAGHTYLPRALAELEREGRLSRIPLAPFGFAQTCALAEQWAKKLASAIAGPAWLERIWELSEGNALVVVESVRNLAQHEVTDDLSRLSVPERVRALIRRRVAALSPDARELATLAAVYGRELQPALFAALMGASQLQRAVQELVEAQLLSSEHERMLFTHDRVRETLYAELAPATRRLIHGRIAALLTPHASGAVLGQAGYHHAKAGNAEAAIALLYEFAAHAARSHALGEALGALDEAARQAHSLGAQLRARAVTQLAVRQAFCLAFLGRFDGMVQLLEDCAELAAEVNEPQLSASYHYWRGFALTFLGRNLQAAQHAERALAYAAVSGDERMLGFAHNLASHQHFLSAQFVRGREHAERALELLALDRDEAEPVMFAHMNMCLNVAALGDVDSALATAARAEDLAALSGSGRAAAMGALVSGCLHVFMHRWDLALAAAQRALTASQTPFTLGPACALLALTQLATGQAAQAVGLIQSVLAQFDAEKPLTLHVAFVVLHAEALLRTGELEHARQVAAEAAQTAKTYGLAVEGFALRAQGLAELQLGQRAASREHLEASLSHSEGLGLPFIVAMSLRALAELEHDQTPRGAARAQAVLARAHAAYMSMGHSAGAQETLERMRLFELQAHTQLTRAEHVDSGE